MMFGAKDNEDGYVPMSAGDAAATWHLHRSHLPPPTQFVILCVFSPAFLIGSLETTIFVGPFCKKMMAMPICLFSY